MKWNGKKKIYPSRINKDAEHKSQRAPSKNDSQFDFIGQCLSEANKIESSVTKRSRNLIKPIRWLSRLCWKVSVPMPIPLGEQEREIEKQNERKKTYILERRIEFIFFTILSVMPITCSDRAWRRLWFYNFSCILIWTTFRRRRALDDAAHRHTFPNIDLLNDFFLR